MYNRYLFRYFRAVRRLTYWSREKLTRPGQLVAAALVASAMAGVDTNRTMAYQAFTFLCAFAAISFFSSRIFKARFKVSRELPKFGTAGQPLSYTLSIKNVGGKKLGGLFVVDNFQDSRPGLEVLEAAGLPRGPVGRYQALWKASAWRGKRGSVKPLPQLGPGAEAEVRVSLTPKDRGRMSLESVSVLRPDPFNLINSIVKTPLPQSVLILPKRYPLPPVDLPGMRKHQPGGFSMAHSVGDSEEFFSMRDYRPGDPLKHIHWRSWAKTRKPIVKEYQEEFFVRHALILDTFSKDESRLVFEEAVSVAASFASSVQTRENLLDLMFVGAQAYCFTSGRGVAHQDMMLEVLASVQPCREKPFSTLQSAVLEKAPQLSGCICVFLSWDDERKNFVRSLEGQGIPVLALVMGEKGDSPAKADDENSPSFTLLEAGAVREGLAGL